MPIQGPKIADQSLDRGQQSLLHLLRTLRVKFDAHGWFSEPVDPERHKCSDYYDVVSREEAMDFGTMEDKIRDKSLKDLNDFEACVERIIACCRKYNTDETNIVRRNVEQIACEYKGIIEKKRKTIEYEIAASNGEKLKRRQKLTQNKSRHKDVSNINKNDHKDERNSSVDSYPGKFILHDLMFDSRIRKSNYLQNYDDPNNDESSQNSDLSDYHSDSSQSEESLFSSKRISSKNKRLGRSKERKTEVSTRNQKRPNIFSSTQFMNGSDISSIGSNSRHSRLLKNDKNPTKPKRTINQNKTHPLPKKMKLDNIKNDDNIIPRSKRRYITDSSDDSSNSQKDNTAATLTNDSSHCLAKLECLEKNKTIAIQMKNIVVQIKIDEIVHEKGKDPIVCFSSTINEKRYRYSANKFFSAIELAKTNGYYAIDSFIAYRETNGKPYIKVHWSDDSFSWEQLKNLRSDDPVGLAEWAEKFGLQKTIKHFGWISDSEIECSSNFLGYRGYRFGSNEKILVRLRYKHHSIWKPLDEVLQKDPKGIEEWVYSEYFVRNFTSGEKKTKEYKKLMKQEKRKKLFESQVCYMPGPSGRMKRYRIANI